MSANRSCTETAKRPPVDEVVARLKFAAGLIRAEGNSDGLANALLKDAENYVHLETDSYAGKAASLLLQWVEEGKGGFPNQDTLDDAVTFARLAQKERAA